MVATAQPAPIAGLERYERLYDALNARGRVVAVVDHKGEPVERYRWLPTCVPLLIPPGDVNADGVMNAAEGRFAV
jgi:hypothetical protein